jgi:hypothetical protein
MMPATSFSVEGVAWTAAEVGALTKYQYLFYRFIDEMLLVQKLLEVFMRDGFSFAEKAAVEKHNSAGDMLLADVLLRIQKHPEGFPMLIQALRDCSIKVREKQKKGRRIAMKQSGGKDARGNSRGSSRGGRGKTTQLGDTATRGRAPAVDRMAVTAPAKIKRGKTVRNTAPTDEAARTMPKNSRNNSSWRADADAKMGRAKNKNNKTLRGTMSSPAMLKADDDQQSLAKTAPAQMGGRGGAGVGQLQEKPTGPLEPCVALAMALEEDCWQREALIELFEEARGWSWTRRDGWCTNEELKHWYGVTMDEHGVRVIGLHLSDNNLAGRITGQLGKLKWLEHLVLSTNALEGPIPSSLGSLVKLQTLAMASNKLSGCIPSSIGGCIELVTVDLSHNSLAKHLPGELVELAALTSFDASQNMLTGPIPASLGRGCVLLARLNLCNNKLSGPVPKSLGGCTALEHLNLASNKLSGNIPSSLGACKRLQRINLMSNCVQASVPSSLNECSLLEIVDLRFCRPETEGGRGEDTPSSPASPPASPSATGSAFGETMEGTMGATFDGVEDDGDGDDATAAAATATATSKPPSSNGSTAKQKQRQRQQRQQLLHGPMPGNKRLSDEEKLMATKASPFLTDRLRL